MLLLSNQLSQCAVFTHVIILNIIQEADGEEIRDEEKLSGCLNGLFPLAISRWERCY
jgi:hypothetical protein